MKTLFFLAVIFWLTIDPPFVSHAENRKIDLEVKQAQIHYLQVKNEVILYQTKRGLDTVRALLKHLK